MALTAHCTDTCCRPEQEQIEMVKIGSKEHRASKDYDCRTCGEPIPAGSTYVRVAFRVDGEMTSDTFHRGHD